MTTEEKAKAFADELDELRIKYGLQDIVFFVQMDGKMIPGLMGKPVSEFSRKLFEQLAIIVVDMSGGNIGGAAKRRGDHKQWDG